MKIIKKIKLYFEKRNKEKVQKIIIEIKNATKLSDRQIKLLKVKAHLDLIDNLANRYNKTGYSNTLKIIAEKHPNYVWYINLSVGSTKWMN